MTRSTNLKDCEEVGDALPQLPEWAAQGLTWAPSILQHGSTFVLYNTARYAEVGLQCISRAVSDSPESPFTDDSTVPFICQTELGGSIDPSPFIDIDGKAYLLWKNDGNCCGKPVNIWIHNFGEADESFILKTNCDPSLLGTKVIPSQDEVAELLGLIENLATQLREKLQ